MWDAVSRLLPRVEWEEARRALGVSTIEQNASLSAEAAALTSIVSAAEADAGAAGAAGFERNTLAAQVAFFVEGLAAARSGAASRARGSRARSSDGLSSAGSCASVGCGDTGAVDAGGASAAARNAVDAFACAADENGRHGASASCSWLWADATTLAKLREALSQEAVTLTDDIESLRARLLSMADVRAALPAVSSDAASLAALRARKADLQHRWIALEAERDVMGDAVATAALINGARGSSSEALSAQRGGVAAAAPAPSRAALKLRKALASGDAADGGGGSEGHRGTTQVAPVAAATTSTTAAAAPANTARAAARGPGAGVLRVRGAQLTGDSSAAVRVPGAAADDDERFFS